MKVTLVNYAQQGEKLAELSAAICVGKLDNPTEKGMLSAINSGHDSVLEHLPLTWVIEDVSRALTHQLVRHRIASYSQSSQRYCKINTNNTIIKEDITYVDKWYVVPKSVFINNFEDDYCSLMDSIAELYNKMCENGVPNEDARMVLPNACFTSIIVSMNARSLVEQCSKRLCKRAQWEIRELYTRMVESIKDIYPHVWEKCVPPCKKDGCKEIKPCKK